MPMEMRDERVAERYDVGDYLVGVLDSDIASPVMNAPRASERPKGRLSAVEADEDYGEYEDLAVPELHYLIK